MKRGALTAAALFFLLPEGLAETPKTDVPGGAVAAALPTSSAGWIEFLGKLKDRIPPCSVEWKVVREIPANPEMAAAISRDYDKLIAEAKTDRDREMQTRNKASLLATVINAQTIPLTVKLNYYSPKRYYIYQSFDYPDRAVVMEYFANDDGIIFADNANNRNVRLLPDSATILEELARGLPEIVLSKTLGNPVEVEVAEDTPEAVVIDAMSHRRSVVRLWMDKATLQVTKWQETGLVSLVQQVETERIRLDSGYAIVDETVSTRYSGQGKVHMKETWTLVDFKARPDPAQMHATKYMFKPRYSGTDETGPKPRRFDPAHGVPTGRQ